MIEIYDNFIPTNFPIVENVEKQRTVKWYTDRWGKITSSKLDCICAPKGIGKEGITYLNGILYEIYNVTPSDMQIENMQADLSWETKNGKIYEPEARIELSKKLGYKIEEVEFKEYPGFEGFAGDSSDGKFLYKGIEIPIELKCTSKPSTYMKRSQKITPKHQDFWQCQGHILAYNAPFMVYAVYDYATDKEYLRLNYQVVMPEKQDMLKDRLEEALSIIKTAKEHNLMSVDDELTNYTELRILPEL